LAFVSVLVQDEMTDMNMPLLVESLAKLFLAGYEGESRIQWGSGSSSQRQFRKYANRKQPPTFK
jgi:hypothetical protein